MSLLVIFVFGAVVVGAGLMLSPALPLSPTSVRQYTAPRVGLASALALGVVVAGAMFITSLFGWDTLNIDYLLFALLVGIFLGGTLSRGDSRGQEAGVTDAQLGWPGPRELAFVLLVLLLFTLPTLILPVPLDTDAQGFGYLALMLRQSGSLTTLAPFHPEVQYLYSPGFPVLVAYLSNQLGSAGMGIHVIQFAVSAVLGTIFVWVLWDWGNEIEDWMDTDLTHAPMRHAGVVFALSALLGLGLFTAYMDSHFTTLMALTFAAAFLAFTTRWLRRERWPDALAAAVCLGMVPLSHPDTTIILALGYVPWLGTLWLAKPRPTLKAWLVMACGIPLVALLGILPWLSQIGPLLGGDIASPFDSDLEHWRVLVLMHGGVIIPFVLGGVVIALRKRSPLDLLMVGWLLLVVDFSTTGILRNLAPGLLAPILKYDYPFSIAWHGPIIPYAYLAARALLWIGARIGWLRLERTVNRLAWPAFGLAAVVLLLLGLLAQPLLEFSKGRVAFFGAFSSAADVQAMLWLREHAPPDALILNHPGPHEADWAPVISERDTVFFRPQPFFQHTEQVEAVQDALAGFWAQPTDAAYAALLRDYGVDYVLVPQALGNPAAVESMWRWREPFTAVIAMQASLADVPYLELLQDFDGAQIYAVVGSGAGAAGGGG